ncbi:YqeG family HAD IIIA-type phosphatase [bacterium]|nr:YqeG family HAD IIIA-type phosphatase [bacterium]
MFIKPDYNLKSIYDINFDELRENGISAVLFDLDSTLMASKSGVYSSKTIEFLNFVKKYFFIAVVSNNKNSEYIEKVRNASDFPLLFNAGKPRVGKIKKFLGGFGLKPVDCVLVGDRPLTDILCGKFLGCKTILVDSITADSEAKIVRLVRALERTVVKN